MSDSGDATTPQTFEPPRDSRLTKRLLARATEPLGLIDVRHARSQHARIMDWVAERLALVEQLRARYGLTDETARGELALAVAFGQTPAEGFDRLDEAAAYGVTPTDDLTHTPEQFTTSYSSVTSNAAGDVPDAPRETLRISRRGVPTFSRLDSETGALPRQRTHSEQGSGDAATPARSNDSDAPSLVAELTAPRTPATMPLPVAPSRPSSEELASSVGERPARAPVRQDKTRALAGEISEAAAEAKDIRGEAKPRSSDESAHLRPSGASANQVTLKPVEAMRAADLTLATPTPQAPVAREEVDATLARRGRTADVKSPAAMTAEAEAASVSRETGSPAAQETDASLARAKEIRSSVSGREAMSFHTQSHMPLAASQGKGERAASSSPPHASSPSGTRGDARASSSNTETIVTGYGAAPAKPPAVNVGRLAEQVSRHLTRRLLVERERRGLGRG